MDKNQIEKCFSKAASDYDSVADIQWRSSQMLISLLDDLQNPTSIVDIGCGTGNTSLIFQEKYPKAEYTLCDISQSMLDYAQKKFPKNIILIHADAESYDFIKNYDLGISNLSMQWFLDIEKFLEKIMQICRVFAFSTLTKSSFQSYREHFESPPTFDYPTVDEILTWCNKAGLVKAYKTHRYIKNCNNFLAVAKYFRKLGAFARSNEQPVLKKSFSSPISLEYEVIFVRLEK